MWKTMASRNETLKQTQSVTWHCSVVTTIAHPSQRRIRCQVWYVPPRTCVLQRSVLNWSPFDLANHVALKQERRIMRLPRPIVCHLYSKMTKYVWYQLIHLSIWELEHNQSMRYCIEIWFATLTCLPIQVLVPALNTSIAFPMSLNRSSPSSHRSGRNSRASLPKTVLSNCVTIAFIPTLAYISNLVVQEVQAITDLEGSRNMMT